MILYAFTIIIALWGAHYVTNCAQFHTILCQDISWKMLFVLYTHRIKILQIRIDYSCSAVGKMKASRNPAETLTIALLTSQFILLFWLKYHCYITLLSNYQNC